MPKVTTPHKPAKVWCASISCSADVGTTRNCHKCYHMHYLGQYRDRSGRTWRWEYSPHFGPTWLNRDGLPLSRQPDPRRHRRIWQAWGRWMARTAKQRKGPA